MTEGATEASTTVPLPALRRHLLQITSPAGPTALGGANPAARAVRRLMVTPWFAVATGFVVAAGLWLYSPHAELNIPNGAVGRQPCKSQGCGLTTPNNHGNSSAGGSLMPMTGSVGRIPADRTAAPKVKFGYRVTWQSQGRFSLLITVSGTSVPHSWRLAFALPGDSITFVQGASWQPTGRYGAIVTWPASDNAWPFGVDERDHHRSRMSEGHGDSFIVSAVGVVVSPGSCTFNGHSCEISPLR